MNLIIDVGNTYAKLAVFDDGQIIEKNIIKNKHLVSNIKKLTKEHPRLENAILSSVGKLKDSTIKFIQSHLDVLVLNSNSKLPFKNLYKSPKTLGVDRIALVCASIKHNPNNNVLIIDAGTCITYDFITNDNEYLGGAISPGIKMRYKALHNFTANLPLLVTKFPKNLIGNSTSESIHSGIINGILKEIDGIVLEYEKKYQDLTVILTGGDAKFLSKQLKSSIFANSNFLLEGLNFILEYNTKEWLKNFV